MRKLWITGCIVMICMGMLTACGGNKMEVVPIGDTEEADREVPMQCISIVWKAERHRLRSQIIRMKRFCTEPIFICRNISGAMGGRVDAGSQL